VPSATNGLAGAGWLKVAAAGATLAAVGVLWPPLSAASGTQSGPPDTSGAVAALLLVAGGLAAALEPSRSGAVSRLITASRLPVVALSAVWLPAVMALGAVAWSAAVLDPLAGLVPPKDATPQRRWGVVTLLVGGLIARAAGGPSSTPRRGRSSGTPDS